MARILPSIQTLFVLACAFVVGMATIDFSSEANAGAKRKGSYSSIGGPRKYAKSSSRHRGYRTRGARHRKAYGHRGKSYYGKRRSYAAHSKNRIRSSAHIGRVNKNGRAQSYKQRRNYKRHYTARSGVRLGGYSSYYGYYGGKPKHQIRHYGKPGKTTRHKYYRGSYAGKRYKHHNASLYGNTARYHDRKRRHNGRFHRRYHGNSLVISVSPPTDGGTQDGFQPCPENTNCSYRLTENGNGPAIIKLGDPGLESSPKIITFEGAN